MLPTPAQRFGIYAHVPWCRARCPYCAFNVETSASPDFRGWLRAIQHTWADERSHFAGEAHSLYLGGGTPSLLPADIVAELVSDLPLQAGAEVTLEANPGTIGRSTLEAFVEAGVTRLSLGVQSLQAPTAKRLGRGHTIAQAQGLLRIVSELRLKSWSFDLIFAVPGQTMAQLRADLQAVVQAQPPHVSLYGLSIEPGTPFADLEASGKLTLPDAEAWRAQYDTIVQTLEDHGWERYEVSNFAKPGHRGVHNEQVWRGGFYAGLGPGAHGFRPNRQRTSTEPSVATWMDGAAITVSQPTAEEAAVDHMLSTLRHIDGTTHSGLLQAGGHDLPPSATLDLCQAGVLTRDANGIQLTPTGFALADGVIRRLSDRLSS
jgi:putative oxygen-independent coproporphyrinogen III oxidase